MVSGLQISEGGDVLFALEVDPERGPHLENLRQAAEKAVAALKGVRKVTVVLTAQNENQPSAVGSKRPSQIEGLVPGVKKIVAVASGKGGVGKSTLAANLAISLSKNGHKKIGLLDADIYGPSQPRMMGLAGQKPGGEEGKIEPLDAYGIKVMSIGFMINDEAPLIWRGPMVQSAIVQLMRDVNWGELDILVVDMPPGTGDAQLTMAQKVPLAGAVIISTPQDIALLDARKAVEMFKKVNVPILGIVENMSTHICKNCGHEDHIFGHGGAKLEAEKLGVKFLGDIPLDLSIRQNADEGKPAIEHSEVFRKIADGVIEALKI
jgi:ATP-binding protein involved in chromosome partitioning